MRHNHPVTQQEYELEEHQYLISQTDPEGNIVFANPDFVAVSGFDWQELMGSPHNMVRHPDMPPEAFADFWKTIRDGHTWTGLVKNRRKNGDHYWVHATVTPIFEAGRIAGYASVRMRPDDRDKQLAETVYARMRAGQKPRAHLVRGVIHSHAPKARLARLTRLTVGRRLALLIAVAALGMTGLTLAGGFALHSMYEAGQQIAERGLAQTGRLQSIDQRLSRYGNLINDAMGKANGADVEALESDLTDAGADMRALWQRYLEHGVEAGSESRRQMDALLNQFLTSDIPTMLASMEKGSYFAAISQWRTRTQPRIEQLHGLVNDLVEEARQTAMTTQQRADESYQLALWGMVGLAGGVLLILLIGGLLVTRGIVQPLRATLDLSRQIAAGNLSAELDTSRQDEFGRMMNALNAMRRSLISIVEDVKQGVEVVTPATADIASGNADLSRRTEEQAAALEQTASSMEELNSTVAQGSESAADASRLAGEASGVAERGGQQVGHVVSTMEEISEASTRITNIVGMIDDIAFQTNILALNASVEAARAGEQGRGFAVVAGEVRALAGRSAEAAREIKSLITTSSERVEAGSALVAQTRQTMDEIVASIHRVSTLMGEVSHAAVEQRSGIEQVTEAVNRMDQMTQQNAALVEQSAASANALSQQAEGLRSAISIFRIKNVSHAPITGSSSGYRQARSPESTAAGSARPAKETGKRSASESGQSQEKHAGNPATGGNNSVAREQRNRSEGVMTRNVQHGAAGTVAEDEWETF
ncbi:methyl-accepting chemotaxis sensory transducer with Pas/Pac sensor [Kushneria sinocarnis]|uniref:Methyl-accepting chemotaxis sensory transducer with Pas/Pac sensor n=1 Tax=Kushneria sinocarnis TaxID=595502 RepID=A0A420WY09_9GAMM|nr:PAS domain-containing methyl-accepting chemotaxis protein [Kushneria sinocarnis]RKR06068.1 methyl-accepting chemotaxis sensory transducer with Pas/Pac sensor [Kushneria sinocarnis]